MSRLYFVLFLFLVSIFTFNCQKEISFKSEWNPTKDPVTATVQGNIVDENGDPVAGVNIKAGTKSTTTNAGGFFRITNVSLDKKASLVIAEMPGYYKAMRSFSATTGANYVRIRLIRKTVTGTVDATNGGSVSLSNGSKVTLPANAVVKASGGGAYSGQVKVYLAYIDPTDNNISQTVPGSFMADDKNNRRVTLESFGMLAVELESAAGEKLQISSQSSATITTAIPASLQSSAPSTIQLWYVDEKTGIWKEEGSATRSGNNYIGDVKHFSFWNCDIGVPAVYFQATFKTSDAAPLVQTMVRLTHNSSSGSSYAFGYTDSLGQVGGLVPANATLEMDVLDPCYNIIYNQNIGPFTNNTNLGVITVTNPILPSVISITGNVKNCTNQPVDNGYVMINMDNWTYYRSTDNNGMFSISILRCGNTPVNVEIVAVDNDAQTQSAATNYPVTGGILNTGDIQACGVSATQWINYSLDGTNYSMSSAVSDSFFTYQQTFPSLRTIALTYRISTQQRFDFYFSHNAAPGNYTMDDIKLHNFDSVVLVQPYNVVLTNYPSAPGQFYEGNFSGSFTRPNMPAPVHTLSGSFRIRRNY